MDNLEDRQREMRERNTRSKREKVLAQPEGAPHHSPEVFRLKKRIAELKEQVSALQLENNRLREQKTIVVERSRGQEKSYGDSVKEQQHNFFKYSNARKY
jgi:regulator of replication initiation timing